MNGEERKLSVLDRFRYKDEDAEAKPFKVTKKLTSPSKKKQKKIQTASEPDYSVYKDLAPSLEPDLKVIFVGFNPGLQSSIQQHHYAHFTNLFWKLFNQSRLLPAVLGDIDDDAIAEDELLKTILQRSAAGRLESSAKPENDFELVKFGIGFTDLLLRCTKSAQELTKEEKLENVPRLIDEFKFSRPKLIAFVGKGIWECIVEFLRLELSLSKFKLDKSNFVWGKQEPDHRTVYFEIIKKWKDLLGFECGIYVFPNTSGLVTSLKFSEKLELWEELVKDLCGTISTDKGALK